MTVPEIDWAELRAAAIEAKSAAYAPYSSYPVGAALLAADGTVFTGVNVENASYGLCLCAERNAVGSAVTAGARSFLALVVSTQGPKAAAPCGMCRQVLSELGPSFPIHCIADSGDERVTSVEELLPHAFDGGFLEQGSLESGEK